MELILKYYDGINTRSLQMQKELQELWYLLDLKKSKTITNTPNEDEKKIYETKLKMYLTKLNTKQILSPKPQTLDYYKIKFENQIYFIENSIISSIKV